MDERQNKAPQMGQVSRLEQVRRRRRNRKIRRAALIGVVAVAVLIWFTGVFGSGLALASDLLESARIGLTPGSFPARTGMDESYQILPLAGGFLQLGEDDLAVWSAGGAKLRTVQHGYSRPAIAAGSRRFCLYNRSGNEVRVESRLKNLDTLKFDNPVMLCAMSQNGSVAVVTRSTRYAAELKIYDPTLRFAFGWSPTDAEGTPIRVAFADDNRRLAVACIRAQDGSIGTGIYWLDTRRDQVQADVWVPGTMLIQMQWVDDNKLLAVFEDRAVLYNTKNDQETSYSFEGSSFLKMHSCGRNTVLLLSDSVGGQNCRIVMLDQELQVIGQTSVQPDAFDVVCTRTEAYSLSQDSVICYDLTGQEQWRSAFHHPPKALLAAKDLLVFNSSQVDQLKKMKADGTAADKNTAQSVSQSEENSPSSQPQADSASAPESSVQSD